MTDREIFKAAEQLQNRVTTLASEVEMALPRIEDALHGPDEHPGGEPSRQAFIDLCLQRLIHSTVATNIALNKFLLAFRRERCPGTSDAREEAPPVTCKQEPGVVNWDECPGEKCEALSASTPDLGHHEQMPAINFQRFKNLREPSILERAIEIQAPLRGEERPVLLRLEALRLVDEAGYEIAVYRQETILVSPALHDELEPESVPREARIWVVEDLIPSDRPTAENALEQVMGFLDMRCG